MKRIIIFSMLCVCTSMSASEKKSAPVVKETTKNINTTITVQEGRGDIYSDTKDFCAKTKEEAEKLCNKWLDEQKNSLKEKLLTSHCSAAEYLYGSQNHKSGCMSHYVRGELRMLIK